MQKNDYLARAKRWLTNSFDLESRKEVENLMLTNIDELKESFYKNLEFGTGGLRAKMGVGTNRVNRYTIGMATQGVANYLNECYSDTNRELSIAVAFDNRVNSSLFARVTAEVFAANGFRVYLYPDVRPTPQLSFTVRSLGCVAGVMVTASHNPKEYNGYKLYWCDGAQVLPPHDKEIIRRVEAVVEPSQVRWSGGDKKITTLEQKHDDAYLDAISKLSLREKRSDMPISIVYTPLHGAGAIQLPAFFRKIGFNTLHTVDEQMVQDGNFPTLASPNPEEPEALKMAITLAKERGAHLVLATDPDCDRVGVATLECNGEYRVLNGNEIASLLVFYILETLKERGELKSGEGGGYIVKTIVTTDLIRSICDHYGVELVEVLTGFKYIAQIVERLEGKREFIAGGEESHGFNIGDIVRDKDGVITSALIAEMTEWAAESGKTLSQLLNELYLKFGLYKERLFSVSLSGIDGKRRVASILEELRVAPPLEVAGERVVLIHDYLKGESVDLISDLRYGIELPLSNVIQIITSSNTIITIRPSGTEPKLKLYIGAKNQVNSMEEIEIEEKLLLDKIDRVATYFLTLFTK